MTKLAERLKQGAEQAWDPLSEGWRELSWGFLAADVFDDDHRDGVPRIEMPKVEWARPRRIAVRGD